MIVSKQSCFSPAESRNKCIDKTVSMSISADTHLVVTGSVGKHVGEGHKKTEMYTVETKTWTKLPDFPTSGY